MTSFYGGPPGVSFRVSEIFRNKQELLDDLSHGRSSVIGVGDYVFISYGLPSDGESNAYDTNREIDEQAFNKTYNATLWQKDYQERKNIGSHQLTGIETIFWGNVNYGLCYKLITVTSGNTPKLQFELGEELDADQQAQLDVDMSNIDKPIMVLHLPQNERLRVDYEVVTPNQEPKVDYDNETDVNKPLAHFSLPRAQQMQVVLGEPLNADEKPDVKQQNDENGDPVVTVRLPQGQILSIGTVTAVEAIEEPRAEINDKDINNPKLDLWLPKAWLIAESEHSVLDAGEEPVVHFTKDEEHSIITLSFDLPQSQVLELGTVTELKPGETPQVELDDEADINHPKLNIALPTTWDIIEGEHQTLDAGASPVVHFSKDEETNTINLWFELPQSQVMQEPSVITLEPAAAPSVEDIGSVNEPKLQFGIPRAAWYFYGDKLGKPPAAGITSTIVEEDMMVGDYYVSNLTGDIYKAIDKQEDGTLIVKWIACLQAPIYNEYIENDAVVYSAEYVNGLIQEDSDALDKEKKTYNAQTIDEKIEDNVLVWHDF